MKIDVQIADHVHNHSQKFLADPADILVKCEKNRRKGSHMKKHLKKHCRIPGNSHGILYGCQMSKTADREKFRDSLHDSQ